MNALTIHDHHFGGAVTRRSAFAWVPDLVAAAGPRATEAYIEFFTATIRNRNTRLAYARACYQFFHWARENGLTLDTVRPFHVAAYIEQMPGSKPTIKQKLAAIRMLYDFLVIRQLVPVNPTASVRGPKYVVKRGKTPVWSREDAKKLLESIPLYQPGSDPYWNGQDAFGAAGLGRDGPGDRFDPRPDRFGVAHFTPARLLRSPEQDAPD